MNDLLPTIREVQEGGKYLANHYLAHGYLLLDIQVGTRGQRFSDKTEDQNAQQFFVRRNPVYVLGRPEGVEPAPPIPRRAPRPGEAP